MGQLAGEMMGGLRRQRGRAPFRIEIVELATERVVGQVHVDGPEGEARGMMALMRTDLDALDSRAFLRRWGGRRP